MDTLREKEQALQQYYDRLNTWYGENEAALQAAKPGNGTGNGGGTPNPNPTPAPPTQPASFTAEDVRRIADQAVNDAGRDYIAVSAFLATQGARHSHLFNEPLDMTELVANPKLGKPVYGQPGRVFSLQDAYLERYGERIQKKQQEAEDKRINDEVEKRLKD